MILEPGPTLQPGDQLYERLKQALQTLKMHPVHDGAPIHPLANLLPMLPDEHRPTFRASLAEGQNHPIVFHKDMLLDGRNRARELTHLGHPITTLNLIGNDLDALSLVKAENIERRHLKESQRAHFAALVAQLPVGTNQHSKDAPIGAASLFSEETDEEPAPPKALLSQSEAADMFNVSRRSVQRAASYQKDGIPELSDAVQAGQMAVSTAAEIAEALPPEEQKAILDALPRDESGKLTPEAKKEVRKIAKEVRAEDQAEKKKKRAEKEAKLAAKIMALPDVRAGLILSDIEWHFKVRSKETGMDRHAANHYVTAKDCDTAEEIYERVKERFAIAADDNVHLMWVPACFSAIGHRVLELLGYTYVSQFVWIKPGMGTGFWVRDCHELLLIGVKGKVPAPAMGEQFKSAIEAPKGEHSEKPDFQYEIAEKYFPNLPKVELNARRPRAGWIQWGNEAPDQPGLDIEFPEPATGTSTPHAGETTTAGAGAVSSPALPAPVDPAADEGAGGDDPLQAPPAFHSSEGESAA